MGSGGTSNILRSVPARVRSTDPSLYFATVNAEFNWWMLMVGLVVGAGLVWFVVADQRRREVDIDAEERAREALWLSTTLTDEGENVSPELAERLLALHRDLSRCAATGRGGRHGLRQARRRPRAEDRQSCPLMTGGASTEGLSRSVSDTPNVVPGPISLTSGVSPTQ